jgi:histidine triad (HIT) family protein
MYQYHPPMGDRCVFCRIVTGEAPHHIVAETHSAMAFMNAHPAVFGHVLVIPKRHAADIWALEPEDAEPVWALTRAVAHAVRERLEPDGLNLFQANREAAWQSVSTSISTSFRDARATTSSRTGRNRRATPDASPKQLR